MQVSIHIIKVIPPPALKPRSKTVVSVTPQKGLNIFKDYKKKIIWVQLTVSRSVHQQVERCAFRMA